MKHCKRHRKNKQILKNAEFVYYSSRNFDTDYIVSPLVYEIIRVKYNFMPENVHVCSTMYNDVFVTCRKEKVDDNTREIAEDVLQTLGR